MHILLYVCMKMCVYMNEWSIYKAHLYSVYCVLLYTQIIQSYTVYTVYIYIYWLQTYEKNYKIKS